MQNIFSFISGFVIAILGGLIGLGGAEYRLPVLVELFKIRTLQAIVINLVVSLVTVIFSFIFRIGLINFDQITGNIGIVINILAGSLIGAYIGVNFTAKINERTLTRIVMIFLFTLSFVLAGHNLIMGVHGLHLTPIFQIALGFFAGIVIGIFSSMLGVAGGELIIPTIVLVFSKDIKLAGSLSLAISIPTIIMGLVKYQQQRKLRAVSSYGGFILWMVIGSILGALVGSHLLNLIPSSYLYILLGVILFISALKMLSRERSPRANST